MKIHILIDVKGKRQLEALESFIETIKLAKLGKLRGIYRRKHGSSKN